MTILAKPLAYLIVLAVGFIAVWAGARAVKKQEAAGDLRKRLNELSEKKAALDTRLEQLHEQRIDILAETRDISPTPRVEEDDDVIRAKLRAAGLIR